MTLKRSDEMIRDQLIEACHNHSIRRKFLESASETTLDKLLDIARSIEAVELQLREMKIRLSTASSKENLVNAVNKGSKVKKFHKPIKSEKGGKKCYRCGETGHLAKNSNCPSRSETCTKCRLIGHREECCRTNIKKQHGKHSKAYNVDVSEVSSEDEFVFVVTKDRWKR